MLAASFALGALNVVSMLVALRGSKVKAAWIYMLIQIPWTVYDVSTHQYGFFFITFASLLTSIPVILKGSPQQV
jgi:hypothetical protein